MKGRLFSAVFINTGTHVLLSELMINWNINNHTVTPAILYVYWIVTTRKQFSVIIMLILRH